MLTLCVHLPIFVRTLGAFGWTMKNSEHFHIRITPKLLEELEFFSNQLGRPKAQIIKEGLRSELERLKVQYPNLFQVDGVETSQPA